MYSNPRRWNRRDWDSSSNNHIRPRSIARAWCLQRSSINVSVPYTHVHSTLMYFDSSQFVGSATAPVISGSLAQNGKWRWYFCASSRNEIYFNSTLMEKEDLNIPICGLVALCLFFSVDLHVPQRSFKEKIASVDWT